MANAAPYFYRLKKEERLSFLLTVFFPLSLNNMQHIQNHQDQNNRRRQTAQNKESELYFF